MIVTIEGGPDENPRYEKAINCLIKHFVENGINAFFLATNAPGLSAFNRGKPRMVKLNKKLSSVILEHDKFGSHLDAKCVTVEIWSGVMIGGNPVVAQFIEDDAPVIVGTKSEEWKACHVRQS